MTKAPLSKITMLACTTTRVPPCLMSSICARLKGLAMGCRTRYGTGSGASKQNSLSMYGGVQPLLLAPRSSTEAIEDGFAPSYKIVCFAPSILDPTSSTDHNPFSQPIISDMSHILWRSSFLAATTVADLRSPSPLHPITRMRLWYQSYHPLTAHLMQR